MGAPIVILGDKPVRAILVHEKRRRPFSLYFAGFREKTKQYDSIPERCARIIESASMKAHDTHTQWKHRHTGARMHACERAQAVPQVAQSEQPESVGPQQGLTFLTSTYL